MPLLPTSGPLTASRSPLLAESVFSQGPTLRHVTERTYQKFRYFRALDPPVAFSQMGELSATHLPCTPRSLRSSAVAVDILPPSRMPQCSMLDLTSKHTTAASIIRLWRALHIALASNCMTDVASVPSISAGAWKATKWCFKPPSLLLGHPTGPQTRSSCGIASSSPSDVKMRRSPEIIGVPCR